MRRSAETEAAGLVKNAVLIAGPTASGKSAAAVELAVRLGGAVVNSDSMQGYAVLDILTARPGPPDLAKAPHLLFGHVHPTRAYSTGAWLRDVRELIEAGTFVNNRPIFTGGTGLYFRALVEGLAEIPEIPAFVRERWRYELKERGADRLHRILMREDPRVALKLNPMDGQRIVRALEVLESTGRSIVDWQAEKGRPLIDAASASFHVVEPARDVLARRIEDRFDGMIACGVLDEVKALLDLNLDPSLPAMKAIGVRELSALLGGGMDRDQAIEAAKAATRQYAKRQTTWFRHQFGAQWRRVASAAEILAAE
ncbi:MAG: tRNA (adenosine(37)-N6)-dimethylallyltransferase MiaA [Rhizobiaceae bacterium]